MVCAIILVLSVLGTIVGLCYLFLVWNFGHWKRRGVNGPEPAAWYGNFPGMVTQRNHIIYDIQEIYEEFHNDHDFVGVFMVRTPQLMVLNPQLLKKIYVSDFKNFHDNEAGTWFDSKSDKILANNPFILRAKEWKERRQEITPGLSPSKIKAVYPMTQQVGKKLVQFIRDHCVKCGPTGIDAKDLSLRYTSEVVADCVLGIEAHSLTDHPMELLKMAKSIFMQTKIFTVYSFLAGLYPTIKSFYKAKFFPQKTEDFFFGLMNSAFKLRRENKIDRDDFLSYILQMQVKKGITNEDISSHAMTFLLDGLETSASVITHCLYQLAKKPSVQEKLRAEILANIDANGEIEFKKLNDLSYLDQCLYESMRIIPPILFATKLCTEPYEMTNKNGRKLKLNVDDAVIVPIYSFQHDPRYYPNPEEYIPERFDPDNGGTKKFSDMGVLTPFGDGPRICLGMKFALTQTKMAILEIIKNFNVKLNPRTRMNVIVEPVYFIGALKGGVWLEFEERK